MNTAAFILITAAALLGNSVGVSAALFGTSIDVRSLRCNGDLAEVGDSKASVLQKCGEPFFVDTFCKPANQVIVPPAATGTTTVNVLPCQEVDEWSYNPGPGQFITIVRFEAGVITSIRYGDRVE